MATYTVAFLDKDGSMETSRFFNTAHAARKWATWLRTLPNTSETSIYRGQSGCELIERKAA